MADTSDPWHRKASSNRGRSEVAYDSCVVSRRLAVLLAAAIAIAQGRPIAQADAFFNAWLNLQHSLWSKGEGAPLPADMPGT
jgi:hypothetical protein